MSQPEKQPEVGDVLLLDANIYPESLLCRVVKVVRGRWEAEHITNLMGNYQYKPLSTTDRVIWYGPDATSWRKVTNLGKLDLEG